MSSPKIKSATALRSDLYETLKEVSEGKKQIITHKQGEPVMLISMSDYDELIEKLNFLRKTSVGLSQIANGEGAPHSEALKKFEAIKKKWK